MRAKGLRKDSGMLAVVRICLLGTKTMVLSGLMVDVVYMPRPAPRTDFAWREG